MNILIINSILEENLGALAPKVTIMLIFWFFVLIAVAVDFVAGIKKAKSVGETLTSGGYRRTVNKLTSYLMLMLYACMMDIVASIWLNHPFITIILTLFILFIEAKSVFEKANEKDRRRFFNGAKDLTEILSKEDLLKAINEYLEKKEKNDTIKQ